MVAGLDPARAGTARITVTALGLVLGLSSAATLPLLLPWQGATLLTIVSVSLGLAPFVGLKIAWRRAAPQLLWLALAVGAVSGLALVPLWNVYRGRVRVLNLGEEPFGLWVDGRRVTRVEPTSGESALAGVELALPAGPHDFRVVSELDGRELFRARQQVAAGSPHLFVPIDAGYCFSIERRGYGDSRDEPAQSEPLEGSTPFWVLPDGISWFTPNPEPGPLQTSGGTLSCLRQKRCRP
jgi:hypothetical protein